jgi:hypothetical protein
VAGDRWLELVLARGKSEHQRAACLVKARVPRVQAPGNGKCHRKRIPPSSSFRIVKEVDHRLPALKLGLGKGEKAG